MTVASWASIAERLAVTLAMPCEFCLGSVVSSREHGSITDKDSFDRVDGPAEAPGHLGQGHVSIVLGDAVPEWLEREA